eukprot:jgi/Ulvmu1/2770/UM014_0228.1
MASQRPQPSPLPAGLDHSETPQKSSENNISLNDQTHAQVSMAEHYAKKASELMVELRNADKKLQEHEMGHQQQELWTRAYVATVEAKYRRLKDQADVAQTASLQWKEKCTQVTDLCRSLTHRNDECESLLQAEQLKTDTLHLEIREMQSQAAVKDKDIAFLQHVHEQEINQLQAQLKSAEQRAKAADERACASQRKCQEWQSLQADVVNSLPNTWNAKWQSLDPSFGTSLPRNESLRFQQQPASPATIMRTAASRSSSSNPVHVFRQVYRNRPGKQSRPPEQSEAEKLVSPTTESEKVDLQTVPSSASTQTAEEHQAHLQKTLQVLRDVAELCKYFARSLHLGYQKIMKPFIGQKVVRDREDPQGRVIKMLQGFWSSQRQQTLETVASAMARLCSASESQAGAQKDFMDLTMPEQAALRAESKRLRRAAENGFFVVFASPALLTPTVQAATCSTMSAKTIKAADRRPPLPVSSTETHSAPKGSVMSASHTIHAMMDGRNKMGVEPGSECGEHRELEPCKGLHIPAHYSGDQIREALDRYLKAGAVHTNHQQQHMLGQVDLKLVSEQHGIMAARHSLSGSERGNRAVHQPFSHVSDSVGACKSERHAIQQAPVLEQRLMQTQNDLSQVIIARSPKLDPNGVKTIAAGGSRLLYHTMPDHILRSGIGSVCSNHAACMDRRTEHDDVTATQYATRRWTTQHLPGWESLHGCNPDESKRCSLTVCGETKI